VTQTTRITSIWGTTFLVGLVVAGLLEGRVNKRTVAQVGGWGALAGFALIVASGPVLNQGLFYLGVVILGCGTGLSTVSNLSLMLDMTTADKVGLFIGVWGMANAISRLLGSVMGGAVRDLVTRISGDAITGYITVFALMAGMMLASLVMLRSIDVRAFRKQVEEQPSLVERAAIAGDA
jgi:BCD family chlorophyll transporter-like MFS transporter